MNFYLINHKNHNYFYQFGNPDNKEVDETKITRYIYCFEGHSYMILSS
jgi:hypothetical protein